MKCFNKLLYTTILFIQTVFVLGQTAEIHTSDSLRNNLLKERAYQLISGFDTISRKHSRVFALYMKQNKFGLLDANGNEVVKARYDAFPDLDRKLEERYALYIFPYLRVYNNNLFGLIDYKGKEILPVAYSKIQTKTKLLTENHQYYRVEFVWYKIDSANISFKMDSSGRIFDRVTIPKKEKTDERYALGENTAMDSDLGMGDEGYSVSQGHLNMPYTPRLKAMENLFDDGTVYNEKTRKYGYRNKKSGAILIPIVYDRLEHNRIGHIIATKNKTKFDSLRNLNLIVGTQKALYDFKGKVLIPLCDDIKLFNNLYFLTKSDKMAIYDTLLNPISEYIYDNKMGAGNHKIMSLALNGKYALFNLKGQAITDFEYDKIVIPKDKDLAFSMIIATKNGNEAIMDYNGQLYTSFEYDRIIAECHVRERNGIRVARGFDSGNPNAYFFVKKNNLWGIMDTSFRLVVECKYSDMNKYYDKDIIYVQKEGNWGILRISDKYLIYPIELPYLPNSELDFFVVFKNGKYGIIKKDGTKLHDLTLPQKPRVSKYYPGLVRIQYHTYSNIYNIYVDDFGNKVTVTEWRER